MEVSLFYVIYVDEIFFVNFIMNMALLYMVKKFRGLAATFSRIAAAAAIGAGGIIVLCLVSLSAVVESMLAMVILPLCMLLTAFHIKSVKSNIISLITLYLNSAMTGGILQMIFYHTTLKSYLYISHYRSEDDVSAIRLIFGAVLAIFLFLAILKLFSYKCHKMCTHCTVVLMVHGKKVKTNALIDTGNGLYEPISGQPVCIIYYPLLKKYFHKTDKNKLRMIPARTIGGGQGWLYALPIEQMEVCIDQWQGHFENIYVALDSKEFCGCQVLLHPAFVQNTGSSV